jgi:serine/threonine-protein kinase
MPPLPTTIGRYQVRELIGHGGMGVLYLAFDPAIDRPVAVKVLRTHNEDLYERFTREARSAGRLQHPNIVTIYDVGEHEGQPFIAMEYIAGQTLGQLIASGAPIPLTRKLELVEELCDGLAYAHRAGIVHRDVKPSNLILTPNGMLKILDFGIARIANSGQTHTGTMIGTPNYMSPEQVRGQRVDLRSDVFAVGLVFYELLTFRQAFPGDSAFSVIQLILNDQPESLGVMLPDLDPAIVRIVERAIDKQPERRYQELDLMRRDLERTREALSEASADETVIVPLSALSGAADPETARSARRNPLREDLARRRAEQIDAHLRQAEEALEEGRLEQALQAAEQAAFLDPDDPRTLASVDRVREAIDARQVRQWLDQARTELNSGAYTSAESLIAKATELDPSSEAARALSAEVQEGRARRERDAERKRRLDALVASGRQALEADDPAAALRIASDAVELAPESIDARALRDRAHEAVRQRIDRDAERAADLARRRFAAGAYEEAIGSLTAFPGSHPVVDDALAALRAEMAAIRARQAAEEEARRRAEQERVARERAIDAALTEAGAALEAGELGEAGRRLDAIAADASLDTKRRGELDRVRLLLAERTAVARRKAAVASFLADARTHVAKGDFARASAAADAALALEQDNPAARAMADEVEAARAAEEERRHAKELDERAQAAVAAATEMFDAGRHEDALGALRRFGDAHPVVATALADLERRHEAAIRQAREEEERARREALARAVAAAVAAARVLSQEGRFREATEHLETFHPPHPDIVAALAEVRLAAARAEAEQRQAELRRREEEIRACLADAEKLGADARFDEAIERVEQAIALNPASRSAQDVRKRILRARDAHAREDRRRQHEGAAREAVVAARRAFERGDRDSAIASLERFAPPHPEVSAALVELGDARDALLRKLAEEAAARREHELRARSVIESARRQFAAGRHAEAVQLLEGFAPAHELVSGELASLSARAAQFADEQRQQVEHVQREIQSALDEASGAVAIGDLLRAKSATDRALSLDPEHEAARAMAADLAVRSSETERHARDADAGQRGTRVRALLGLARAAPTHEAAMAAIEEALALDPDDEEARAMQREHATVLREVQVDHEDDAAVTAAIGRARSLLDAHRTALAERTLLDLRASYASTRAYERHRSDIDALFARVPPAAPAAPISPAPDDIPLDATVILKMPPRLDPTPVAPPEPRAPQPAVLPPASAIPPAAQVPPRDRATPRPGLSPLAIAALLFGLFVLLSGVWWLSTLREPSDEGSTQPGTGTKTTQPAASSPPSDREGDQTPPVRAAEEPASPTAPASPAPAPPAAETKPTAPVDHPSPHGEADAAARQLRDTIRTARHLREQGETARAIARAEAGLRLDSGNGELRALAGDILDGAASTASDRRAAATAAGATGLDAYRQADELSRRAELARRDGRLSDALSSWQLAADRYQTAATAAPPPQPPPTPIPLPSQPTETRQAQPSPGSAAEPPKPAQPEARPPAPAPQPPAFDGKGIAMGLIGAYRSAYHAFDVGALRSIYPGLPKYRQDGLAKNKRNCSELDVRVENIEWVRMEPNEISLRSDTTYDCRTRSGQSLPVVTKENWVLKPSNGRWLIDNMAVYER